MTYCRHCGSILEEVNGYCTKCGTKVEPDYFEIDGSGYEDDPEFIIEDESEYEDDDLEVNEEEIRTWSDAKRLTYFPDIIVLAVVILHAAFTYKLLDLMCDMDYGFLIIPAYQIICGILGIFYLRKEGQHFHEIGGYFISWLYPVIVFGGTIMAFGLIVFFDRYVNVTYNSATIVICLIVLILDLLLRYERRIVFHQVVMAAVIVQAGLRALTAMLIIAGSIAALDFLTDGMIFHPELYRKMREREILMKRGER